MKLGSQRNLRPWRRVLRLGDRGPRVVELQRALARLGLYPASPDGVFGYLTQDAVERLQKEFGLRVDGVAGPMVARLLSRSGPRKLRLQIQDVSAERTRSVACLLIGYIGSEKDILIDQYSGTGRELSAVSFDWWNLGSPADEGKEPSEKLQSLLAATKARYLPVVTNAACDGESRQGIRSLTNRDLLRRLLGKTQRLLTRADVMGVMFRLGELPAAVGPEVRKLLRDTARVTRQQEKLLFVCVPDWKKLQNTLWGLSWSVITNYVDYVVLEPMSGDAGSLLPLAELRSLIPKWLKKVPSWQLVMGIPAGGLITGLGRLPYNNVRTIAYRKKAAIQWDTESMSPMYRYWEPGEDGSLKEVQAWYENGESLAKKLAVIRRYKAAGLMLYPLGYEDSRTWEVIKRECIVGHL